MSSLKNNINSTHAVLGTQLRDALHVNGYYATPPRSRTPNGLHTPAKQSHFGSAIEELGAEEDPKLSVFKELYARSEARLESLFEEEVDETAGGAIPEDNQLGDHDGAVEEGTQTKVTAAPKKPARAIDEDDYDESDGEDEAPVMVSPTKSKIAPTVTVIPGIQSVPMQRHISSNSAMVIIKRSSSSGPVKSSEDVRKKLEEDKKATEDAAKRSFHTLFYTLENDRDAMLDQKKLEESERQVDVEMGGTGSGGHSVNGPSSGTAQQGTLSQTNLGASSLTFKHLIARIDAKRDQVRASDAELRSLMSEVRKNRSKWASEEKVGQEELYEAAERVLTELKAYIEHSTAFITRVNKREAPDYYNGRIRTVHIGDAAADIRFQ
jgi:transcriptional activator SPT7